MGSGRRQLNAQSRVTALPPGLFRDPRWACDVTTVHTDDGAQLHVRGYGPASAQPIVLIHGLGCRIEYWNPQVNCLAERYRVLAYDQRGAGRSSLGTEGVRPETLGDDLAAVLEAVLSDGQRAVLVGHSFGGITIMAWAQRHARQIERSVSAVVLADTVAERFSASTMLVPFAGNYRVVRRPLVTAVAASTIALPSIRWSRRLFRRMALSPHADGAAVEFVHAVAASCPAQVRGLWGAQLSGLNVVGGVENLTVPTTVVVGREDRLTPPAASRRIAEILRKRGSLHRFVQWPRVGHCSNVEVPHAFNAEIERLAESVGR